MTTMNLERESLEYTTTKIKMFFLKLWFRHLGEYAPPKILWESYWPKY